jgi:hypothetical protein
MMKLTEAIDIRSADLKDEWAQRFIRELRAALDATEAADRDAKTKVGPS